MNQTGIITDLNLLTKTWRRNHRLFSGGCAYASAILARTLKKAGIHYDIIIFDCWENNAILNNDSCGHMGIKVRQGRKHTLIGGPISSLLLEVKTNLGEVDPDTLLNYYHTVQKESGWNPLYDISCNSTFSRLCNNILKKYSEI